MATFPEVIKYILRVNIVYFQHKGIELVMQATKFALRSVTQSLGLNFGPFYGVFRYHISHFRISPPFGHIYQLLTTQFDSAGVFAPGNVSRMSNPQSRFSRTWKSDGKILDPPNPPMATKKDPRGCSRMVVAVEDSGLLPGSG
jgi:hypothetical protein